MTAQDLDRAAWFKGASVECSIDSSPPDRPFRLVLLGAPGVGKGTQAELISQRLRPCHLSTGDVFRAAKSLPASERTPAITQALACMQRGELVPDDTVINIVRERSRCMTCPAGFLLDGFPRTVRQAEALDVLLTQLGVKLDAVLSYDMPLEQVIARLSGRRTCAGCKAVFHVTGRPPKVPDVCDNCGGQLVLREDDRPESIRVRMQAYQTSTAPLTDYYQKAGLLVSLSAAGAPEEIYQRTAAALSSLRR
jgi:adenylate kinase